VHESPALQQWTKKANPLENWSIVFLCAVANRDSQRRSGIQYKSDFWTSDSWPIIQANIDPPDINSPEEIEQAPRRVEPWEVVAAKGGLNAALDANFSSHGQRQLFCLARALLRKSKVVVLDEVTRNVDVSDALMQWAIREEFADRTVLAVAHRLETIIDFDIIAVMQDGELIEFDTPEALLKTDSAFKELYES
jgi:ABC-type multidrug transport system fused ATPase/permease subunit